MKLKHVHKFVRDDGQTIEFIPVANVPGYSHRVAFNGILTREYLASANRPNQASALYFFCKLA